MERSDQIPEPPVFIRDKATPTELAQTSYSHINPITGKREMKEYLMYESDIEVLTTLSEQAENYKTYSMCAFQLALVMVVEILIQATDSSDTPNGLYVVLGAVLILSVVVGIYFMNVKGEQVSKREALIKRVSGETKPLNTD